MIKLNRTIIEIIKYLSLYGKLTKKNRPSNLSGITFYMSMWYLRDKGIIKCNGVYNRSKIWVLTEKGKEFAEIIKKLENF